MLSKMSKRQVFLVGVEAAVSFIDLSLQMNTSVHNTARASMCMPVLAAEVVA